MTQPQAATEPLHLSKARRWWGIGGVLAVGLFVAYIDRTNLSVGLPGMSQELGFSTDSSQASWALTAFLVGYAVSNILGGILTRRIDPKVAAVGAMILWSCATLLVSVIHVYWLLIVARILLGIAEGFYWPQMSRFARSWFAPDELTKANSIIQFYGQFIALATGFAILSPIHDAHGWRILFVITGVASLVVIPLYVLFIPPMRRSPYVAAETQGTKTKERLTFESLGSWSYVLIVIAYITQGMLFWGITLWIPMAVTNLGFTGGAKALCTGLPYLAAVLLAIPISRYSDRTGKRIAVAAGGMMFAGACLVTLPFIHNSALSLALITVAMGVYAASFTPNIWSIIQLVAKPHAVGTASGIMNGLGAGGGGTLAGFLVGALVARYGSYAPGFALLGGLVLFGSICLLTSGRLRIHGSEPLAKVIEAASKVAKEEGK